MRAADGAGRARVGDGRRATAPIGIAIGLAVTFVLATLLASRVLNALGLPQDLVRNLGIALLALVGVMLLVPRLGELAGPAVPAAAGAGRRAARGRRRVRAAALAIGAGLGVVWAPCAGPILTAVTVLAARNRVGVDAVAALGRLRHRRGAAAAGRRDARPARHGEHGRPARTRAGIRRATGAVLVLAAVLFTTSIPDNLAAAAPGYTDVLQAVERSDSRLEPAPRPRDAGGAQAAAATPGGRAQQQGAGTPLQDYGPAPEFTGISTWLDTRAASRSPSPACAAASC